MTVHHSLSLSLSLTIRKYDLVTFTKYNMMYTLIYIVFLYAVRVMLTNKSIKFQFHPFILKKSSNKLTYLSFQFVRRYF